jgi:hypothetical protein
MTYQDYLEKVHCDPRHPGSFGGVDKLYKFVRKKGKYVLGKAKIRQWLETQETFGFHRQIKRKFSRRKVIVPFIEYQWDADTAVMKSFTKDNDGYGYLLLAIDVFSHYMRTFPLKTTQGKEKADALNRIFQGGSKPEKLRSDKGVKSLNKEVSRFFFYRKRKAWNISSFKTNKRVLMPREPSSPSNLRSVAT